jgi:hypothetical protein
MEILSIGVWPGKLHFFNVKSWFFETFWNFLKLFDFFEIVWKQFQKVSEMCNLNFVTSELDSESLSTLRKIIFKRDSCKVGEVAAPVITSCAKNV